jgi:polar amino acid transport system permease protein
VFWSWHEFFSELTTAGFAHAAWATLWSASVVEAAAVVGGFLLVAVGRSSVGALRLLAGIYVWLWRGTPLLVQLLIVYFGLPQFGIRLGVIGSGIITLALNESAYIAVLAAAALRAVPPGQTDAAMSLGLPAWRRFRYVIFPQAFRVFLPVLGNQYNAMLKTTSLLSVISFSELVEFAQSQVSLTYQPSEAFAVAALYYLALTLAWSGLQKIAEARFATVRPAGRRLARDLLLPARTKAAIT